MDLATIILIICVIVFAFRGFKAGLIKACGRILALIGGYGASLFYASELGQRLSQDLELSPIVGMLTAAVVLFFGAAIVINMFIKLLLLLIPNNIPDSTPMKLAGAGIGAAAGVVISVILMWFLSLLQGAQDQNQIPNQGPMAQLKKLTAPYIKPDNPDSLGNKVLNTTTLLVSDQVAAQIDTDDMIASAVATLMTQPGETIASLKRLSRSEELQALLNNPANQQALMMGEAEHVVQLDDFKRLMNNSDMRRVFDPTDATDAQLANTLSTLWQRSQAMKNDPEIQAILQDPEMREQLQSNNPAVLISNPKSLKLIQALLSPTEETPDTFLDDDVLDDSAFEDDYTSNPSVAQSSSDIEATSQSATATSNYVRWVDEEGKVHYGDQLPQ